MVGEEGGGGDAALTLGPKPWVGRPGRSLTVDNCVIFQRRCIDDADGMSFADLVPDPDMFTERGASAGTS